MVPARADGRGVPTGKGTWPHRRGRPAYDHAQVTGIAAAHVGYELLSALASRKG